MLKAIFMFLGPLFQGVGGWMAKYGDAKNTEARVIEDEQRKKDEFNDDLKNKDIDAVRRKLS